MRILSQTITISLLIGRYHCVSAQSCEELNCISSEWCAFHSEGYNFCKAYAGEGEKCNFYTLPEFVEHCNPETHFCYEPEGCIIFDMGGRCEDKSKKYKLNECCSTNTDCETNNCVQSKTEFGIIAKICQEEFVISKFPCLTNNDCEGGHWCAPSSNGEKTCIPYAEKGEACSSMKLCDPGLYECRNPDICADSMLEGRCELKSKKYELGECCSADEDCESNNCAFGETKSGVKKMSCQRESSTFDTHLHCTVGDKVYENGEYIGFSGLECVDGSTIEGFDSYCIDGSVVEETQTNTCAESSPMCFQCGPRGHDQAICKTEPNKKCESCVEGSAWNAMNDKSSIFNCDCPGSTEFILVEKLKKYLRSGEKIRQEIGH